MKDDATTTLANAPRPAPDTLPEGRAEAPPVTVQLSGEEANEQNAFGPGHVRDGVSTGNNGEPVIPAPVPAPGRFARFRAAAHRRLGTTLFFTFLGVYSIAGVSILNDGDQLTWTGVAGFTVSMLARYRLHDRDSRNIRLLKCFGDIAAVVLMASIVRDSFALHPLLKWSGYALCVIFCWYAARVFDREVFGTPDSDKNETP